MVNVPTVPPLGTLYGTQHKVTIEGLLRILVFICHAIIVAMATYIYGLAPLMRVKATMLASYICFAGSLQVWPMRLFSSKNNRAMLWWVFATDIAIWAFVFYFGTAVASAIGLVHSLNKAGKFSDHNWNTTLTAMILIWITLFFHSWLVLFDILLVAKKPEPEEDQHSTRSDIKETAEGSLDEYTNNV